MTDEQRRIARRCWARDFDTGQCQDLTGLTLEEIEQIYQEEDARMEEWFAREFGG